MVISFLSFSVLLLALFCRDIKFSPLGDLIWNQQFWPQIDWISSLMLIVILLSFTQGGLIKYTGLVRVFKKDIQLNTSSFRALFHASEMVGHLTKYIQFRGNNGKGERGKVTYGSQRKEVSLWKYDEQNGRGGKFAGRWKTWDIALTVSVLVPPPLPSLQATITVSIFTRGLLLQTAYSLVFCFCSSIAKLLFDINLMTLENRITPPLQYFHPCFDSAAGAGSGMKLVMRGNISSCE